MFTDINCEQNSFSAPIQTGKKKIKCGSENISNLGQRSEILHGCMNTYLILQINRRDLFG